ncbi:hypothetical protein [Anatilimnocola floriformis]|uniref:hypothetical protein n=1 Tax=Anatilimnocola floriformis TaxID=2948575 RepID=UPI0020C492C5|nr:hypothetical protein [Anatilimnocola floriformis]
MRIRYSLRTFLIAVSVVAVAVWLGTFAASYYSTWRATKHLESRRFLCGYFAEPNGWAVEICDATSTDWRHLRRLGELREIAIWNPDIQRPEFRELVQQNQEHLRELMFNACDLSPELAATISDARQLESLIFWEPNNSSQPFVIPPLPHLNNISFLSGDVSDENLEWIANQPAATAVYINNKLITDKTAEPLAASKSLRRLGIAHTSISTAGVRKLMSQLKLQEIALPAVQLDEADVLAMANSELVHIDLRSVDLIGSVTALVQCERIQDLEISLMQYETLMSTCSELSRRNKLRLHVHELESVEDIPATPWEDAVEMLRYSRTGSVLWSESELPNLPGGRAAE